MRIISLDVANVLRVRAVHLEPNGSVTVIAGKNGQGKSSVLAAIEMCLAGADAIPPEPLRRGAKKGKAVLDLGDIVVTRSFTASGTTLNVKTADGQPVKSPQALLDTLIGRISFDPSEFARMDAKEQLATLQKIVGLDFNKIDKARADAFTKRTEVNRRVKEVEARLKTAAFYPDAPEKEHSIADLRAELERRQQVNANNQTLKRNLNEAIVECQDCEALVLDLTKKFAEAKGDLEIAVQAMNTLAKTVEAAVDANVQEARQALDDVEDVNRKVRANFGRKQEQDFLQAIRKQAEGLTTQIEACDSAKEEALAAAKFPVPGLGFTETGVTMNGLPFEQCSAAETIAVSMAIGLSLNPKLPVVLIKHGSLIDSDQLEVIRQMADERKAQVIVERVGLDAQLIIEDGHVRGEEVPDDMPDLEPAAEVVGSGEGP